MLTHKHRHVCAHTYLYNQHCMIILSFSKGLEILKHSDNFCLPMGSQPLGGAPGLFFVGVDINNLFQ